MAGEDKKKKVSLDPGIFEREFNSDYARFMGENPPAMEREDLKGGEWLNEAKTLFAGLHRECASHKRNMLYYWPTEKTAKDGSLLFLRNPCSSLDTSTPSSDIRAVTSERFFAMIADTYPSRNGLLRFRSDVLKYIFLEASLVVFWRCGVHKEAERELLNSISLRKGSTTRSGANESDPGPTGRGKDIVVIASSPDTGVVREEQWYDFIHPFRPVGSKWISFTAKTLHVREKNFD